MRELRHFSGTALPGQEQGDALGWFRWETWRVVTSSSLGRPVVQPGDKPCRSASLEEARQEQKKPRYCRVGPPTCLSKGLHAKLSHPRLTPDLWAPREQNPHSTIS